jgi:hypothetical protein
VILNKGDAALFASVPSDCEAAQSKSKDLFALLVRTKPLVLLRVRRKHAQLWRDCISNNANKPQYYQVARFTALRYTGTIRLAMDWISVPILL